MALSADISGLPADACRHASSIHPRPELANFVLWRSREPDPSALIPTIFPGRRKPYLCTYCAEGPIDDVSARHDPLRTLTRRPTPSPRRLAPFPRCSNDAARATTMRVLPCLRFVVITLPCLQIPPSAASRPGSASPTKSGNGSRFRSACDRHPLQPAMFVRRRQTDVRRRHDFQKAVNRQEIIARTQYLGLLRPDVSVPPAAPPPLAVRAEFSARYCGDQPCGTVVTRPRRRRRCYLLAYCNSGGRARRRPIAHVRTALSRRCAALRDPGRRRTPGRIV